MLTHSVPCDGPVTDLNWFVVLLCDGFAFVLCVGSKSIGLALVKNSNLNSKLEFFVE